MLARARLQLTAWYVAVLLAIISIAGVAAYVALSRALGDEVDSSLRSSARNIASQLSQRGLPASDGLVRAADDDRRGRDDEDSDDDADDGAEEDEHEGLEYFSRAGDDVFYLVLAADGSVLLNPLNVDAAASVDASAVQTALSGRDVWRTISSGESATRTLYMAVESGPQDVVVEVGRSLQRHDAQLDSLLLVLLATGSGGLALAAAGGFWLAGRALQPTREAMERQRRFVADASHELRAPLTLIRASAEAIEGGSGARLDVPDRGSLSDILSETGRMSGLVDDLLTLARIDEGRLALRIQDVSVQGLVQAAAREARLLGREKGLNVLAQAPATARLAADPDRLAQVLTILVDNAARHSPSGGDLVIGASEAGDEVVVWVEDAGPGIPAPERERIFERFYRADQPRTRGTGGSGLGLAIARGLVEAHGGRIEALSGAGGSGARIVLHLPRRARYRA